MKKSTVITIVAFVLGVLVLAGAFILFTDNNISKQIFTTTTTTTGSSEGEEQEPIVYEPMNFLETDTSQYITLGQYKDIILDVDQLEMSQEELDMKIRVLLCQEEEFTKKRTGKITEGIIFNFNYTGYLDGEAFEGGSDEDCFAYIDGDQFITVSSSGTGSFIDGFAQGVLGAAVGDTFEIDITFPDPYPSNTDMSGAETVFEIKINYIVQTNFTNEWVNEYTGGKYTTTKEFEQYIKEQVDAEIETYNEQLLMQKIVDNAEVIEIPQQQFDYIYSSLVETVEYYVTMYAMYGYSYTYEDMLVMFGFENNDALKQYAKDIVKEQLVTYAIISAEGMTVTEEEYNAFIEALVETTGQTAEELMEEYDEDYVREQILTKEVNDLILESNSFKVKSK